MSTLLLLRTCVVGCAPKPQLDPDTLWFASASPAQSAAEAADALWLPRHCWVSLQVTATFLKVSVSVKIMRSAGIRRAAWAQRRVGVCAATTALPIHPHRYASEFAGYTHTAEAVTSEPRDRSSRHFTDYTYTA